MSLVFLILYIGKVKKTMKEKNQAVPDEALSKELLSQFKTEADVSKFHIYNAPNRRWLPQNSTV